MSSSGLLKTDWGFFKNPNREVSDEEFQTAVEAAVMGVLGDHYYPGLVSICCEEEIFSRDRKELLGKKIADVTMALGDAAGFDLVAEDTLDGAFYTDQEGRYIGGKKEKV